MMKTEPELRPEDKRSFMRVMVLFCTATFFVAACVPSVEPVEVYRHIKDKSSGSPAMDLEIENSGPSSYDIKGLSDNARIPMEVSLSGLEAGNLGGGVVVVDNPGSNNIHIKINQDIGHTDYAGLRFAEKAVVNIWENGVVEVDREGLEVTENETDETWVSRKAKVGGKKGIVFFKR